MESELQLEGALRDRLEQLSEIGVALSVENDLKILLERILRVARRLTRADAGTLYLKAGDHLIFEIAQNDSLGDFAEGKYGELDIPPVPINRESASGYAAVTGELLNIDDVYVEKEHRFESPKQYDKMTGYRTRSMLVVPMTDHEQRVIGVLQLLNALDAKSGEIRAFSREEAVLIQSLTAQAAMAINNVRLIEDSRRLHRQNELILNSAGEGIFGLDLEGLYTFVNPAAASMLGYDVGELISRPYHDLCHYAQEDSCPHGEMGCPIMTALKVGAQQRREDELFWRKDGTSFQVEYVATPIREEGEVMGVVVVFKDVTEQRKAEEERRELERHLLQSERMASVGVVTAGIVHNLRNSLTGILNYAELLEMDHPELKDVEWILRSAHQMNDMIEDILAKSRQRKSPERVDLNVLLKRELDFLEADRVFKHQVEKDIRLAENLPLIACVYTDFSQALGNLLRNAVEAMYGRRGKRLTVVTEHGSGGITIEIADTGEGISEEALPHLFEPFFTTKATDSEVEGPVGTGLGLYTLKQLLDPYGVEVEVESEGEVGTTFRLRIPC
jgi:PAS domain S-box-containing protein